MESDGGGICGSCHDDEESTEWTTAAQEGTVSTSFESGNGPLTDEGAGIEPDATDQATLEHPQEVTDTEVLDRSGNTGDTEAEDKGMESPAEAESFWDESTDTSALDSWDTIDAEMQSDSEDGERSDPLDRKIDNWKEQLLDLTRRSNLVNFRATKTKSLPFHHASPVDVAETLLDGKTLYVRKSDEEDGSPPESESIATNEVASIRGRDDTQNSLYRMSLHQKRFLEEKGVDALFIALGTLRWYDAEQSDDELRSPLFLVSADLERSTTRDPARHDFEITSDELEIIVNPALRKKLNSDRGLVLPPDERFDFADIEAAFAHVDDIIGGFDRWLISTEVILGIFDFAKFGLYEDLEKNRETIKAEPLIKAINGDPSHLPEPPSSPSAEELDEAVPAAEVFQVLDADSSQQEAIEAAKRGKSFVLQGPPGTGKSQTIANIIAEKMAAGETVLFVSEKQAALNVVKNRLDDEGLGRFCLEVHGKKANKKSVLETLGRELRADKLAGPADRSKVVGDLDKTKQQLNEYGASLFHQPEGQELTPYEAFGILAEHSDAPRVDFDIDSPTSFKQNRLDKLESLLEGLTTFEAEIDGYEDHPWRHSTLSAWRVDTREQIVETLEKSMAALERLDDLDQPLEEAVGADIESVEDQKALWQLLQLVQERPDIEFQESYFSSTFYESEASIQDLAETSVQLAEAKTELTEKYRQSYLSESGLDIYSELRNYRLYGPFRLFSGSYRRLANRISAQAAEDYSPGYSELMDDAELLMTVEELEEQVESREELRETLGPLYRGGDTDWDMVSELRTWVQELRAIDRLDTSAIEQELIEGSFREPSEALVGDLRDGLDDWADRYNELCDFLDLDGVEIEGEQFEGADLQSAISYLQRLQSNLDLLQDWVRFSQRLGELREGPLQNFIDRFLEAGYGADNLLPCFRRAFYTKWLNDVYEETSLDRFNAEEYDALLAKFRRLDRQQWEHAKAEILHRVTNRRPSLTLKHADSSEQVFLRREIQKSRQHKPLRTLFEQTAGLVTDLTPCFMMSPLAVAQNIEYGSIQFDTVIFDEASQIQPQDAISTLIRGDQVIIAGDSKQLPPTTFFQADVESAEDVLEDLESILDEAASALPEHRLIWHYRSRTNELIEFSNTKYYNGALRTFPENNAAQATGVEFDYVEDGLYDRGGASDNKPEAKHVVDLIEEHIDESADRSLGIVAFSQAQAQTIRDEIEERRSSTPELDAFVGADDTLEGFFVKSLENVQGDERDVLFFSVGYGPDSSGKITMNFGPLNHTGGERRLNVAVTRARDRVRVVSSIQPEDIDLSSTQAKGVEDFKHYLEYAKHGERALARQDTTSMKLQFDSSFEEAVYTALERNGFDVESQVQSSGYSIDLAIRHPEHPGEYLLGIECDGAAYHSSMTARDRDRTRQTVLESLGWEIHRIWSPDWASNQHGEIEAISERVDELLSGGPASGTEALNRDIEAVELEPMDPQELDGGVASITEYVAPPEKRYGNRNFDEIPTRQVAGALVEVVESAGPIEEEIAFKTVIRGWSISRLGSKIKRNMERISRALCTDEMLVERSGFLWPGDRPDRIMIRTNTEDIRRRIDEIPLEEIAKAAHLILENGGAMQREDLVLETTRLFGYQRRGEAISARIDEAIDLLLELNAIEDSERVRASVDDIDERLLDSVY